MNRNSKFLLTLSIIFALISAFSCTVFAGDLQPDIVSETEIRDAYQKYIMPYRNMGDEAVLNIEEAGDLDGDLRPTDQGRAKVLSYLNFIRAIHATKEVTFTPNFNGEAQYAADWLAERNDGISHTAADGIDERASNTLHSSNLSWGSGYTPLHGLYASISGQFADGGGNMVSDGHRLWILNNSNTEMGYGYKVNGDYGTYFGDLYVINKNSDNPGVITYPAAGESPIELITEGSRGEPISWSVSIGNNYRIPSAESLAVSISDDTGKTVNYSYPVQNEVSGQDDWYIPVSGYGYSTAILINPYAFTQGDYNNLNNHTYTVTVSGLEGGNGTISYQTHFFSMKEKGYKTSENTDPNAPTGIYRVYNNTTGEHLYTPFASEVNVLVNNGWTNENIGWYAPKDGIAVYRLYNPALNDHLYTCDGNEVNVLTTSGGWIADNGGQPMFYSAQTGREIYRLYDETSKRHLLTQDQNEYNVLPSHGWTQEGVSLYGLQ